jgi:hypothetical protein
MSPSKAWCAFALLLLPGAVSASRAADPLPDSPADASDVGTVSSDGQGESQVPGNVDLSVVPLKLDAVPSTGPSPAPYKGGRGLITTFGPTGMFLNPTSGTLAQGQLTLQNCEAWIDSNSSKVGYGFLLDYGITDWLDAGGFGEVQTGFKKNNGGRPIHEEFFADSQPNGGPFARVRILKDTGWIPEVSLGLLYTDGYASAYHIDPFIAASKGFAIDPDGILRSIRFHLGYRYRFQNASHVKPIVPGDEAYVFGGVELELPYSIYVVGEQQSESLVSQDGTRHAPYAVGLQWKPNNVLGLSAADLDVGDGHPTIYFGIGLNFQL